MTTENITHLKNHGPSTNDELPTTVESHHRAAGVHSFTLSGNHGDAAKMGGRPTSIYCLPEHTKSDVLRAFLDTNPSLVEAKPRHGLHRLIKGHGQEWLEAMLSDSIKDARGDDCHPDRLV